MELKTLFKDDKDEDENDKKKKGKHPVVDVIRKTIDTCLGR